MQWIKKAIPYVWRGAAIGIAEIIPGVSGGTIAFITGIYEKLIYTIKSIDHILIADFFTGRWKSITAKLDIAFLFYILTGMFSGIVLGVFGVTWLLEYYPEPLWGFFFGLIISSCFYIGKQVSRWKPVTFALLILGTVIALTITLMNPSEGIDSLWYVFICAIIAVSALILPGISGSFILLLLGMYTVVIPAVKSVLTHRDGESIKIVSVFVAGCLVGLATFSRVMGYLFKYFKNSTLALLTGFMAGSLYKIWPWRNVVSILSKDDGNVYTIQSLQELAAFESEGYKILIENQVWPALYHGDPKILLTVSATILGLVVVWIMEYYNKITGVEEIGS